MKLNEEFVSKAVGPDSVSRVGSRQKLMAGVVTQIVSMKGFTSHNCSEFCSDQCTLKQRIPIGFKKGAQRFQTKADKNNKIPQFVRML